MAVPDSLSQELAAFFWASRFSACCSRLASARETVLERLLRLPLPFRYQAAQRRIVMLTQRNIALAYAPLLVGITLLSSSGCGVYMAFTQPPAVDTTALEQGGVTRDIVIERLGSPKSSVKNADGTKEDIYEFYEGSATGWKIGRGLFHLGADIVSIGLWEIAATPSEYLLKETGKMTARANFDASDRLTSFKVLGQPDKR